MHGVDIRLDVGGDEGLDVGLDVGLIVADGVSVVGVERGLELESVTREDEN